jgi:hypothetical protein
LSSQVRGLSVQAAEEHPLILNVQVPPMRMGIADFGVTKLCAPLRTHDLFDGHDCPDDFPGEREETKKVICFYLIHIACLFCLFACSYIILLTHLLLICYTLRRPVLVCSSI